jgi:hypothetical protein
MKQTLAPDSSSDSAASPAHSDRAYRTYVCYAVLLVVLAVFAAVRFHFRSMPLERDEGEYAYMGQLLLQGVPPYKLAYTMKLPGTCMAYAAMMAVFGQTAGGIRIGLMVVTSLCALLVFLLGKRLCGLLAGTIAGITYAFLAIRPGVLGMDGHATHFVVLMALAGILVLLRAIEQESTSLFFASGLLFGLSFLMKQPGIFFAFFAGCHWLWREWKQAKEKHGRAKNDRAKDDSARGNIFAHGAALVLGVVLPYGLLCLWLLWAGVFSTFWFWTWTYARAYGSIMSLGESWRLVGRYTIPWAVRPFVLWEIALAGLVAPLWSRSARARGGFVAGFFLTSALAVCPGFYFRPHYFIVLLPAVAICAGIAVDCAERELRRFNWNRLAFAPLLLFALAYLFSIHGQWKTYGHLDPIALSRKIHYDQPYADAVPVADVIKARSEPQDDIGIIGSEPEICFYTHLRCASSYLYMYPLMEKQPFARQMQNDMLAELQSKRPRFLIYEDDERAWGWKNTLAKNLPFFERAWNFAHTDYEMVDQVLVPVPAEVPYGIQSDRQPRLYVFQRK